MSKSTITIVTRKSPLALWQAELVQQQLTSCYPGLKVEILGKTTEGDKILNKSLAGIGGKDLFVKDLQQTLLNKEADIAVHSIKDMSVKKNSGLLLAAFCRREDPRDVFVSNSYENLDALPDNATIGTSSPRRQCQLNATKPHLAIKPIRGNVGTRLEKLASGEFDAIILAAAGLLRLSHENRIREYLDPEAFIPAIGQGAIGIECHADDIHMIELLEKLDHHPTRICITAERAVNRRLNGDCFTPLAAHAVLHDNNTLHLIAMVGSVDGKHIIRNEIEGPANQAEALGLELGDRLLDQGAGEFLDSSS